MNSENPTKEESSENKTPTNSQLKPHEQKTPIWQVKAHEQWVKTVLITEIIEKDHWVLELCCGSGLEIGKLGRAKIGNYVGIDPSKEKIKEANQRWIEKKKPFPARFETLDPFTV